MKNIFKKGWIIIAMMLSSLAIYAQCDSDELTLTSPADDYLSTDEATLGAWSMLTASNKVLSGSTITYVSDGIIRLDDGFIAEQGSDFWALIGCTTATEEPEFGHSLSIYPNPVTEQFQIEYLLEEPRDMTITLVNTLGQSVKTLLSDARQHPGEYKLEFSTGNIPAGIYFIHFNYLEGQHAARVIKQ